MELKGPKQINKGMLSDLEDLTLNKKTLFFTYKEFKKSDIKYKIIVPSEPSIDFVLQCLDDICDKGFQQIVGIGGGSVLDTAKFIGTNLVLPKILIPTTYSGSEATHETVFKVDNKKKAFVDIELTADRVILIPTLTYTLPQKMAEMSAFDSLAHAIECRNSKKSTKVTKSIVDKYLPKMLEYIHCLDDMETRGKYLNCSFNIGIAFGNSGTTLGHALSYPLSNIGIPHGQAVANVLPYALRFNGQYELVDKTNELLDKFKLKIKIDENPEKMAKEAFSDTRHLENNQKKVLYNDLFDIYQRLVNGKN